MVHLTSICFQPRPKHSSIVPSLDYHFEWKRVNEVMRVVPSRINNIESPRSWCHYPPILDVNVFSSNPSEMYAPTQYEAYGMWGSPTVFLRRPWDECCHLVDGRLDDSIGNKFSSLKRSNKHLADPTGSTSPMNTNWHPTWHHVSPPPFRVFWPPSFHARL